MRLAYWDRLTGLPNRERFRETLVRALEPGAGQAPPVSVLTLDLDRFKHVNDVMGYAFGDRLLQAVAQRMADLVTSPDDMVARLGAMNLPCCCGAPTHLGAGGGPADPDLV